MDTPAAIAEFGVGDRPVQFLVVSAVWPIVVNTAAGVRALDDRLLLVGGSLGSRWVALSRIVLPSLRQHVLTGIPLALGVG